MKLEQEKIELQDYSGEVRSILKMEDFSKDMLAKWATVACHDVWGHDSAYFWEISKRYGLEAALAISREVWVGEDLVINRADMRRVLPAFNIKGKDINSVLKYLQVSPVGTHINHFDVECELKSENYGTLTVIRCPALDRYEASARQPNNAIVTMSCVDIDMKWFQQIASCFNPKIKVTPLTELPRRNPKEVACRWEFKLEE